MRHGLLLVCVLSVVVSPALSRAAIFTVTTTLDLVDASLGDGVCLTADQSCSLRAAIQQANALGGSHTIRLGGGPYQLTLQEPAAADPDEDAAATGDLDVTADVSIESTSVSQRRIRVAFNEQQGDGPEDRIFHVLPVGTLTLDGVSLEDGVATSTSTSRGGAILNEGLLFLSDCTLDGNEALEGGGIYNDGFLLGGSCTFSGNEARNLGGGPGDGGAIFSTTLGATVLADSTFTGNGADGRGGAVFGDFDTFLELVNSTLSGNTGPDVLRFENINQATLSHLTIQGNTGTGIVTNLSQTIFVDVTSSIVSGSSVANCSFSGAVTPGSLTSLASDGSCGFAASGGFDNTDPELGPLADNGGLTLTHLPAPSSLAVDHAASFATCPDFDQRGILRPDGDGGAGACDIGAVELLPEPGATSLALAALLAVGALARRRA